MLNPTKHLQIQCMSLWAVSTNTNLFECKYKLGRNWQYHHFHEINRKLTILCLLCSLDRNCLPSKHTMHFQISILHFTVRLNNHYVGELTCTAMQINQNSSEVLHIQHALNTAVILCVGLVLPTTTTLQRNDTTTSTITLCMEAARSDQYIHPLA